MSPMHREENKIWEYKGYFIQREIRNNTSYWKAFKKLKNNKGRGFCFEVTKLKDLVTATKFFNETIDMPIVPALDPEQQYTYEDDAPFEAPNPENPQVEDERPNKE